MTLSRAAIPCLACLLGVLGSAGCGGGEKAPAKPATERRTPVEVVTAVAAPYIETYRVAAPALPEERIDLSAEVDGTLLSVDADTGQRVAAGQVLARFDPEPLTVLRDRRRAELDRATVRLAIAKKNLARQQALQSEGTVADPVVEDAELSARLAAADLRLAELALKDAERDLGHTVVKAPAPAEVTRRLADPGAVLPKGAPLFHLARTARIRLVPGLSEAQVVHVGKGAKAAVRFDALPGRAFTGDVVRVGSVDEAGQAAFPVEVRIENPDLAIRPGMVGRVELPGRELPGAYAIPAVALRHGERGIGVFVVADGSARRVPVEVAALEDETAIVAGADSGGGGLAAGMEVVVVGQTALRPGEKVQVTVRDGAAVTAARDDPAAYGQP
jgi:RND family efflux transporter MFP subunit